MFIKNKTYQCDLENAIESIPGIESLYGKKFLVTGASGMIASFIIDLLMYLSLCRNAEIEVYALGRNEVSIKKRFQSHVGNAGFHIVLQDVTNPIAMEASVDFIIHAAGDGYPSAFREHPVETMTPAFIGTLNLLHYAREKKIEKVLLVSSGEVYGKGDKQKDGFREKDTGYIDSTSVRSCYPMAKLAAETLLVSYGQEYGIHTVITRLSHVYGPNFSDKDNRATAQFIRNVVRKKDIVLHSPGQQLRSYTYIADCASGILFALLFGEDGQAYNVANDNSRVTIAEFAECLAAASNKKCIYEMPTDLERKEQTPLTYAVLNAEKLEKLGWNGKYVISEGMKHLLQILVENGEDTYG